MKLSNSTENGSGLHGKNVHAKSSMDKIREYYVEQKTIDRTFSNNPGSLNAVIPESVNPKDFYMKYFKGWARPTKKYKRFTEKQKNFIKYLFEEGETQKKKLNTETMAARMKDLKKKLTVCF